MSTRWLIGYSSLKQLLTPCLLAGVMFVELTTSQAVYAQQSLGIAAVVNDEMISIYDLQTRITIVSAFAGFPQTAETQRRIAPQVLRSLIDERLKLQEAKRLNIASSQGDLNQERNALERQSGLKSGQLKAFLKQQGLQLTALDDQLESKIIWSTLVSSRYARSISISDEEIEEALSEIQNNKGKPESLVSEIFLPIDNPQKQLEATKLAQRLALQIRNGANFNAIARNFSQSPSAATGGSLGWNLDHQLGGEIRSIVAGLQPGKIAGPILVQDGLLIVMLHKRRVSSGLEGPPPGPEKITLFQLHLALAGNAAPEQIAQKVNQAQSLTFNLNGCKAMGELAKKSGSPLSGKLGTFAISQISPQMQSLVKDVPKGHVSKPHRAADGIIVLMVCDRIIPKKIVRSPKEQRNTIRSRLLNERLNLAAKRYIRDLRRASFIEVRL